MSTERDDQGPQGPGATAPSEEERARALAAYGLDALEEDPELAAIIRFAANLCGTPTALISLVERERQYFLARLGLDATETPRKTSFCAHTMLGDEVMEVADASQDPRFADNPLVTGDPRIRFYAGAPLVSDAGVPLGALCVIDHKPRRDGLTDLQRDGLGVLGAAVMRRLNARREELLSERYHAQRETLLRALADTVPAMVWSTDGEGKSDYFNRQLLDFVGPDKESNWAAIHPDDQGDAIARWRKALATGRDFEAEHRLRRHDGEYRWVIARAVAVHDDDGRVVRWFGTAIDIDTVHKMSEARELLARELSHRIKNIFAVVSGLVSLSARRRPEHKEFAEELIGTIRALGRAHDYVRDSGGDHRHSLLGMLADLFVPYGEERVQVVGDDAPLSARAATPLALVFHELATNSAKYGALSGEEGTIALTIDDQGDKLQLCWVERGGPPIPDDTSVEGFGSRLVEMSITGQLGGSWQRRFDAEGLVCELIVSKKAIAPE